MASNKNIRAQVLKLASADPKFRRQLQKGLKNPKTASALKQALSMPDGEVVIAELNGFLRDQMTAISQYMIHSEMCSNWGYSKLAGMAKGRAMTEMKHAEALIERIIFLEGFPDMTALNEVHIGRTIPEQLQFDLEAEAIGVSGYNRGIALCRELGDNGTRKLLEANLLDEEGHHDALQAQLTQIAQMGVENYLAQQVD